ncbi:MAG: nucleotidyl transferase AbiEii/AbiGii toxin family protein [Bacteroidia bacterium]|jgi:predicted nucleotidyltransferase component of viral defense system|nr:nucleotidyl transferase AbiEii/AbiGii toxin family protein [Bacteroidia bacterium]
MIKPGEIQRKALQCGVRDQQIEKDYVLTWLLTGIALHKTLNSILVFKGGTVLKKVYFSDYRFSEDLDFTLIQENTLNEEIYGWFREVFEFIKEESNISLEINSDHTHEDGGIGFYISYTGPLGGQGNNKNIKIDISKSEKLIFLPVKKALLNDYSDRGTEIEIQCYSLEEVLIEKLRSVIQRMQARDFYDIWYLLEYEKMEVEFLRSEFSQKCIAKSIAPQVFHKKLDERLPQYKARWNNSLAEQIGNLPDFETVQREVMRHLKKLAL